MNLTYSFVHSPRAISITFISRDRSRKRRAAAWAAPHIGRQLISAFGAEIIAAERVARTIVVLDRSGSDRFSPLDIIIVIIVIIVEDLERLRPRDERPGLLTVPALDQLREMEGGDVEQYAAPGTGHLRHDRRILVSPSLFITAADMRRGCIKRAQARARRGRDILPPKDTL